MTDPNQDESVVLSMRSQQLDSLDLSETEAIDRAHYEL